MWSLARYLSKVQGGRSRLPLIVVQCLDDVRRPALSGIPVVVHVPSMTYALCAALTWLTILLQSDCVSVVRVDRHSSRAASRRR